MNDRLKVFLNPGAGKGAEAERENLERAFGVVGARIDLTVGAGPQLERQIRESANSDSIIGAAGGDGTISTAANALVGTNAALLPIPLGTLNHFSNRYGIPTIEAAAEAWQRREQHRVHVGEVNGRIFVNNASAGFYPHLVRHRERIESLLPRMPAMWLAGMRVLIELPVMKIELDIGGTLTPMRTPAMWVGIGRNSLRLPVPGDAEVEGDVLELVAARTETRRSVVALALRLMTHLKRGIEPHAENLEVARAQAFSVSAPHSIDIALDGEPHRMRGPLEFKLREQALGVVCLVGSSIQPL